MPTISKDSTPEAPKQDNKRPHDNDDDDKITEVPDEDKPAEPPKKKKKKKKNKDSKEVAPTQKDGDDGGRPKHPRWWNQRMWSMRPRQSQRPPKFRQRRPKPLKRRRNRKGCRTREVSVRTVRGQSQRNIQDQTPETPA